MKYNININQKGLENDLEITLVDASVIDWIHTFCGTNNRKINSQKIDGWTWINCNHLIKDMPLLRIKTRAGGAKLLQRLSDLGYIEKKTEGRKIFVKPTDKVDLLYFEKAVNYSIQDVNQSIQSCQLEDTNHNTNTNTNIISQSKITKKKLKEDKPFIFEDEMLMLQNSSWKGNKILWLYFSKKKLFFENRKQFDTAISKFKKPANELTGYTGRQIEQTMEYCEQKFKGNWTLYAISSNITEVINKNI